MSTTGKNISIPIYIDIDGQRTSFENLVLHKSVVDSVVMSLSDNITGDVYYKDNTLQVSLHEYIIYKDVKYVLVSPPTIVREGMASDNSDLRGMTKYSFVFYHPMYQLSNLPFTDVAVSANEIRYKSEDKKFSWIGNLRDFVRKINKNLENTMWVVTISSRVPQGIENKLSDVLTFDNSTIADALKQIYETWEIPFIVDALEEGEESYDIGKRFSILCGLPSNEIYASESDREQDIPFVFRFGKGVGLKNNSATPRNNKIITRIAGYGSEDNIPYGYPQIVWTGNQSWEYTIENDPNNSHSYRIYDGIVGGALVKLIKHPFTRTHLMPSIYVERVNKKVNPYAQGYDPDIELVDYYDADDSTIYPNTIVSGAPSYEQHEFSDIKPELGEQYILNARPINNDESYAPAWDDTMDGEGNYTQSYFKVRLPILNFDLYASAAITQEMQINMRSGACIGCTFPVQVDWEDYKLNFYDSDGNFAPQGSQRNFTKYPDSSQGQIEIILQKEYQTFGVIMPNVYQVPKNGDQFVVLGISLPLSYVTDAQERLDDSMKSFMLENNVHYFDYPLKFDEKFLYDHTNILAQIRNNSIIRFEFAETELMLYVKHITIKYGEGVLPKYDITLTDDVEVVLNQIGQTQAEISKINSLISALQQNYGKNVWDELAKKLSKTQNDTANGQITFNKGIIVRGASETNGITNKGGLTQHGDVVVGDSEQQGVSTHPTIQSSNFVSGMSGWFIDHLGNGEFESLTVRSFLEVTELLINRLQAQEGDTIFTDNDQIESIEEGEETDHSKYYILTLKEKWQGYFTSQQYGNIIKGIINTLAANYEGVSDVDPDECVEVDGNNKYYTSWMRVVADRNTDPTLGTNQIKVVLYGDNEVPAQKNFPPCELMTIGRWGCIDYADPDDSATLASIEKRQRLFYISVSDGRIMKLRGVNSPILSSWNYGTTLGTLPEFVYNWHEVSERALPTRDYLYAQGIIVQSIIEVYPDGQPKGKFIDRGEWQDNTEYLCYEFNPTSGDWETHDVWHNTCKWRCLQHQPVTSGGVTTYYEPKWNSPYWKLIEGNENLSIEFVSSNGTSFRVGFVDTIITPYLFYGSVDISSDIATASWSWTRETESGKTDADRSWDANHVGVRVLHLTNADMPIAWSRSNKAIFTATVVINDGKTDIIIQNQVIA